ncbi:MAG: phosphopantothenate--cysteine ligase [Clostridiales Family XIII bacterium]|jgi:phosphopantothenate-cysteine ligase|nr:phosphopantothenate--cysteine ligase [Clostridiales Family XIII bacterium]
MNAKTNMNILITAGGTTERIDDVRGITNMGTGTLGALIAEGFAASEAVARIFYVCSARAVRPECEKVVVYVADDTRTLERAVNDICAEQRVDVVIHSMAVSDYRVRSVSTSREMGAYIAAQLEEGDAKEIARAIEGTPSIVSGGKVSSGLDDMVVIMERTPKIIAMFRGLLPDAVIVGFKLLVDVNEDELIDTAHKLLKKNDCDYVLANDLRDIRDGGHTGHLLRGDGAYTTYRGKDVIAPGVVRAVLGEAEWRQR